jgi:hypothetical protein
MCIAENCVVLCEGCEIRGEILRVGQQLKGFLSGMQPNTLVKL